MTEETYGDYHYVTTPVTRKICFTLLTQRSIGITSTPKIPR